MIERTVWSSGWTPAPTFGIQPHRRVADFSAFTVVEFDELKGFLQRLKRAGGTDCTTIARTLTHEERNRCEQLVALVKWNQVAAGPVTALTAPLKVSKNDPALGSVEELAAMLGQRLGVTIPDFNEIDPLDPPLRLGAVKTALARMVRALDTRSPLTGEAA